MRRLLILFSVPLFITSCGIGKSVVSPTTKYSLQQIEKDYTLYKDILEEHHPSLYWYTSKDSMDYYFNWGREKIKDSLTEPQFKSILSYVLAKIDCGHTSARLSKKYSKYHGRSFRST